MHPTPIAKRLSRQDTWLAPVSRVARAIARTDPTGSRVLVRHADGISKGIAKAVHAGWIHAPTTRRNVLLDKLRSIVSLEVLDRVVHTGVAACLADAFESHYPDGLHSYRRGRGPESLARAIASVAREHALTRPDPRTRGLWALRFDVASYGDHIPLSDTSPLWPILDGWLAEEPGWIRALVRTLARCAMVPPFDGVGVPTGTAMCVPLVNSYLTPLDAMLASSSVGAFRYGDDVCALFLDPGAANAALDEAVAMLATRNLTLREDKLVKVYWTGSGRRPDTPGWQPARHLSMCGMEIGFDGTRRVRLKRRREFMRELFRRLATVADMCADLDVNERSRVLAGTAATLLNPRSRLAMPQLPGILRRSDCRIQLGEMDRAIALRIASLATGVKGRRSFRQVSWRTLHDLGLPSLRRLRNT